MEIVSVSNELNLFWERENRSKRIVRLELQN